MHMSMHQLHNHSSVCICAMCGEPGHIPALSKGKKKWVLGDECVFSGHSLNKKKIENIECSFPVSNNPMKFPVYNELVWRYDMGKHMSSKHPRQACPPEEVFSAAEKELINKKSRNSKENLKVSDLQKLSDDALKLLPLQDFWNNAKKMWTKSQYGTFAAQQSSRMKRLFGEQNFI